MQAHNLLPVSSPQSFYFTDAIWDPGALQFDHEHDQLFLGAQQASTTLVAFAFRAFVKIDNAEIQIEKKTRGDFRVTGFLPDPTLPYFYLRTIELKGG
jgi:hypothetical protein